MHGKKNTMGQQGIHGKQGMQRKTGRQEGTRKRALHARMSHSTVGYTTVCTKKTLRIPVK